MPSPVGHALAGAAIALAAEPALRRGVAPRFGTAVIGLACLAALPDADLLYAPVHRAITHSVGATVLISIIATAVTGWVTGTRNYTFGLLCGLAWGSHLVLDWLGADPTPPRGIRALWPISDRWFVSDVDLFRGTERRQLLTVSSVIYNLQAVGREVAILGPVTLALAMWRRGRRPRRAEPACGGHAEGETPARGRTDRYA
jgi:hypothetical protein